MEEMNKKYILIALFFLVWSIASAQVMLPTFQGVFSNNEVLGAPTSPIATAGDAQATISFVAPSANGGSTITGYTVTSSPSGFTASGSASPITLTGLSNGTSYTFTVVATNATGNSLASVASNSVTPFLCGTTITFTYNGANVIYGTVLSAGKCWLDRNLGATRVATSSTDASSYGDLFQWGRGADGHQLRNSLEVGVQSTNDVPGNGKFITGFADWRNPSNQNLWQGINGVNNPCPSGFRLPTYQELDAERGSWSSQNSSGAIASQLNLPMAGRRVANDGSLASVGSAGYYWASTSTGTIPYRLFFTGTNAEMNSNGGGVGNCVRCIRD